MTHQRNDLDLDWTCSHVSERSCDNNAATYLNKGHSVVMILTNPMASGQLNLECVSEDFDAPKDKNKKLNCTQDICPPIKIQMVTGADDGHINNCYNHLGFSWPVKQEGVDQSCNQSKGGTNTDCGKTHINYPSIRAMLHISETVKQNGSSYEKEPTSVKIISKSSSCVASLHSDTKLHDKATRSNDISKATVSGVSVNAMTDDDISQQIKVESPEDCLGNLKSDHSLAKHVISRETGESYQQVTVKCEPCEDDAQFSSPSLLEQKLENNNLGPEFCNTDLSDSNSQAHILVQVKNEPEDNTSTNCNDNLAYHNEQNVNEIKIEQDCDPFNEAVSSFRAIPVDDSTKSTVHTQLSKSIIKNSVHKCSVCSEMFTNEAELKRHEVVHTWPDLPSCKMCGRTFLNVTRLKSHERVHTGETPFECTVCGRRFKHRHGWTVHGRSHTKERPYICEICGLKFTQRSGLTSHKRGQHPETIAEEKLIRCQVCQKTQNSYGHLKVHMRKHSGEKPYKCELCEKTCSSPYGVKLHTRIVHTGENPYQCEMCNRKFKTSSKLTLHKRSHTGEKPHRCNQCGKKYSVKMGLTEHVRSAHSGERPFKCDKCGMEFAVKAIWKKHLPVHDDKRPFECSTCGKSFKHKRGLNKHSEVHSDSKVRNLYVCDPCGKTFLSASDRNKHTCVKKQ